MGYCSRFELYSVQFTEILGILIHQSYSKLAICLPEYGLSENTTEI